MSKFGSSGNFCAKGPCNITFRYFKFDCPSCELTRFLPPSDLVIIVPYKLIDSNSHSSIYFLNDFKTLFTICSSTSNGLVSAEVD